MSNEIKAADLIADAIKDALERTLVSPNESDSNLEAANVVDGLFFIGRSLRAVAVALDRVADRMPP